MTRPVGPLPARVYWVRRVIILLAVVLVVFVLFSLLTGCSVAPGQPDPAAGARSPGTTQTSG